VQFSFTVQDKIYGAVVYAFDLHIGGEDACLDIYALLSNQFGDHFVKLFCRFGFCGLVETRASALLAIAVKCEIAHEQYRAAYIDDAEIHFILLVRKNPQGGDFIGEEFRIVSRIISADTNIDKQPFSDLADCVSFYLNFCL
jgi:hypothetical protein